MMGRGGTLVVDWMGKILFSAYLLRMIYKTYKSRVRSQVKCILIDV